jgi:hypothetical protein
MFKTGLLALTLFVILGILISQNISRFQFIKPEGFVSSTVLGQTSPVIPSPTPQEIIVPTSKILNNNYHIFQSFNNCGPAALSMALSYYGIHKSQEELGQQLRPYQVPGGDNDDKSVTLEEVAKKSEEFGLVPYIRPGGNINTLKKFIALNIPVITRTWMKEDEDIGHYRIIKGYDDTASTLIQDDSFQGHDLKYSYDDFNKLWDKFNYEYLVLVPKEKQQQAEYILGEDLGEKTAWQKAVSNSLANLEKNPDDYNSRFNLSVAYYRLGDYQKSVEEFEKVENQLPFRTLWYQIEPIKSYYQLGNYDKVFEITDQILNNQNRAFSELYLLRGNIYLKQGNEKAAKSEFEKAVLYNSNLSV